MVFADRVARLEESLRPLPSLLVALSGGVDSAALLGAAARAAPGRVVAATTVSLAVPEEEVAEAEAVAARLGTPHRRVETHEMDDGDYRANSGVRCYFCRREMYGELRRLAVAEGIAHIADGLQADDSVADRPGMRAAREHGVLHPLRDAGLKKADARRLVRALGLPLHDKPAQPCLASRLPVGVAVTPERLARVHRAEKALRDLGFQVLRVRCEQSHGRVEIGRAELARAEGMMEAVLEAVRTAGFASASLDRSGYRSGS